MRHKLPVFLSLAAIIAACKVQTPEVMDFAVHPKIVEVPVEGGDFSARIYSNKGIAVGVDKDEPWAVLLSETSFVGDGQITFFFSENEGLRRSVAAAVSYNNGALRDTVRFYQEGEEAQLTLSSTNLFIDIRESGDACLEISSNVNPEDIKTHIDYVSESTGWIKNIQIEQDSIIVKWEDTLTDNIQKAIVTLSYTDGWGEAIVKTFNVVLSDNQGAFGKPVSFSDVRAMENGRIEKFLYTTCVVISDCSSKNMEINPNSAYNAVDTSPSDKTAYVQSEDGTYGFKLVFDDALENTLRQKQVINLHLNGLTLTKESDPDRYTLSGASSTNLELISELDKLPSKPRKISELSDTDLYTFVNIQQTEFLNKEGSFTNVHDKYTLPASFNTTSVSSKVRGDSWAGMLADSEGNTIYAMVNMLCPWRRNGSGVPMGVGSLNGILVHNEQPRYGDLGRYQIRVVDKTGYAQNLLSSSSFTTVAKWDGKTYGYNFNNFGSFFPYVTTNNGMDSIIPSDDFNKTTGAHVAELSFENKQGQPASGTKSLRPCQSLDAVKMGTNGGVIGNRALSIQCNIGGWYNWKEDGTIDSYNGIVAELSTASMQGKRLFFYYAFFVGGTNYATFKNFPAKWCVEYSIDGGEHYTICNTVESGKPYSHLRSYPFEGPTVIDGRDYYPTYSTGLGQTEHLVELPSDAIGHEKIKIRLRPYDLTVTSIPENPAEDIENTKAYKGISIFQDLRFDRIIILTL